MASLLTVNVVVSGRCFHSKPGAAGGFRLALVISHECIDLMAEPLCRGEVDGIEGAQFGIASSRRNTREFRVQLHKAEARQERLRVGTRVGAGNCLGDFDHADAAGEEIVAVTALLEGCRFGLVDDQLRDRRGVQIQVAQRWSPWRSASSAALAVIPVVAGRATGRLLVSRFDGGVTRPSATNWDSVTGPVLTGRRCATGRPNTVTSKPSPASTRSRYSRNRCLRSRIPIWFM